MHASSFKFQVSSFHKGFTLIEALVLLFVFSVIAMTFFETYAVGTRLIIESKNRLGATALANQKMEIIRSIDYATIGTKHWNGSAWVYGIPAGDILEDEAVAVNASHYNVHTFVQYVDDPFDGKLGGTPNDLIPNDYKRVRLTVSWGEGGSQSVALYANISPNGIETSAGGGILTVNILDPTGAGIAGVTVHIVNNSASIDVTAQTDSTGNITLPGTPASTPAGTQNYILTVSKSGYYGTVTYAPYPTSSFDPVDEHVSVVTGVLNPVTIVIDRAADIVLHTEDPFGTAVPSINFSISGGRILGTSATPTPGTVIYSLTESSSTDTSGNKTYAAQSYGQYAFSISSAQYEFYKFTPPSSVLSTLDVVAGVNKNVAVVLLDKQIGSVKVLVKNQSDTNPIAGASVHLTNTGLAYDATQTTDQYGYVYFPTALPALTSGTYDMEVSATGFTSDTSTVSISGVLETKTILLTPS
jgi:type II secretory pathway pseudopilin PulG